MNANQARRISENSPPIYISNKNLTFEEKFKYKVRLIEDEIEIAAKNSKRFIQIYRPKEDLLNAVKEHFEELGYKISEFDESGSNEIFTIQIGW